MALEVNLVDFAQYCTERAADPQLTDEITMAERWGYAIIGFSRWYDSAMQESILPALQIVNKADQSDGDQYWREGQPMVIEDFKVVMGAAHILHTFWEHHEVFDAWTKDAPFVNKFGNWIDPLFGMIDDADAAQILRDKRLAA